MDLENLTFSERLEIVKSIIEPLKLKCDLQTTSVVLLTVDTYVTKQNITFILLGKLQTDALEKIFGKYRRLSFFLSVQQVFESEKKLILRNIIEKCNESTVLQST